MAPAVYDIRVFELLPLKIKASVMGNYIVLYGKLPEISEYFYHYRKLWDDCKHRVEALVLWKLQGTGGCNTEI